MPDAWAFRREPNEARWFHWQPMQTPNRLAGLRNGIPATYIKLLRDQSVPPELQDTMIQNIGSPRVIVMDTGHNVMISQPQALAKCLNDLVRDNASQSD